MFSLQDSLKIISEVNMKNFIFILLNLTFLLAATSTILPMNRAFEALVQLIPYISDTSLFVKKENGTFIVTELKTLENTFNKTKHEKLLKQDIFAPSLTLVRENITEARIAFERGKKDYAHWRLQEITGHCLDCHTRIPVAHASSYREHFRNIDQKKFTSPYNLGLAQLIVRLYPEAKNTFTSIIDNKIINKDFKDFLLPLKQILMIQTKVEKNPTSMTAMLKHYLNKQGVSLSDRGIMQSWLTRLEFWSKKPVIKNGLNSDQDVEIFINKTMKPLFNKNSLYLGKYDVDLLFASGFLSQFSFENPNSKMAPDVMYWLGQSEKFLKRESFFGPGSLFLKQCVIRYPKSQIARKCFESYKESIEFEFTGSSGTDIPSEIDQELKSLDKLIQ